MDNQSNLQKPETIPVYVYDDICTRNAHRERIHWVFHILQLIIIVATVIAFLLYLNQYEYVSNDSVTVDGSDGVANYFGKDGAIYNGEDSSYEIPFTTQEEREIERNP